MHSLCPVMGRAAQAAGVISSRIGLLKNQRIILDNEWRRETMQVVAGQGANEEEVETRFREPRPRRGCWVPGDA